VKRKTLNDTQGRQKCNYSTGHVLAVSDPKCSRVASNTDKILQ